MTRADKANEILQWLGCGFIIAGHVLNAIGPSAYPWNVVVFAIGILMFLIWAFRVKNKPQITVNLVSIAITAVGLFKAFG